METHFFAARTIARSAAFVAPGKTVQASTISAKSGSPERARCPCAVIAPGRFRKFLLGMAVAFSASRF